MVTLNQTRIMNNVTTTNNAWLGKFCDLHTLTYKLLFNQLLQLLSTKYMASAVIELNHRNIFAYTVHRWLSKPLLSKSSFIQTHKSLLIFMNFIEHNLQDGGHLVI